MSLLDLSGDGLIVMSRPTNWVLPVLQQEGYQLASLDQPISVCIKPVAFRQLTGTMLNAAASAEHLVRTPQGFALMSASQWQQHLQAQTAIQPRVAVTARQPVTSTRVVTKTKSATKRPSTALTKVAAR